MAIKMLLKTAYTYFFNWYNIVRFSHFGKGTFLGRRCTLNLSGDGVWIGDKVRLGEDARLSCYYVAGHTASIVIKDGAYMGSHVSILTADSVVIEEGVLMASYINILGENHSMDPESNVGYGGQELTTSPIIIKSGSWIGQNVTLIANKKEGLSIGKKSIVGAGSVVISDIPDYCIAVGNPARVIKKYNFETHKWERY